MSEENRWDEDLPEVNENVPTEEKPLDTFGNTDTNGSSIFRRPENAGERLRKWNKQQQFSE